MERLRANYRRLAVIYVRRQAVLRTICSALARASIPAIVLKGAALAHLVYPHPTLRPMVDLDLWVSPDQLDTAGTALAAVGFRYWTELAPSLPAAAPPDRGPHRSLLSSGVPVALELHGVVKSLEGIGWARFDVAWEAAEPASLGGVEARVLCPEHLMMHLCLHLARTHAFNLRLLHLMDIAFVVQRWNERWAWPAMMEDWRRHRVTTWMLLGLTLARDLLGAPVPSDLEARAGVPAEWATMRALATERLWEARFHRLPPALGAAVRPAEAFGRLHWLRHRVFDYYWRPPEPVGPLSLIRGAASRLWHDVSVKVPKYFRGWLSGSLRGPALARGIALEWDRTELERLVVAGGDLGYAVSPAAGPPAEAERAIAGPPVPG